MSKLGEEINLLIQNVALFAAISPPILVPSLKEVNDGILFCFTNIANAVTEAKGLNGGVEIEEEKVYGRSRQLRRAHL